MKRILKVLLTIILLIIGGVYIYLNRENLYVLQNITLTNFLYITLATFAFFCASGYTFKVLVHSIGSYMSAKETVGLSILTNFSNYLMPGRPGAILKAVYLKKTRQLSYSKFTAVLAANMFLAIFMMGLFGMLVISIVSGIQEEMELWLFIICMILVVVSFSPFIIRLPNIKLSGRKGELLESAFQGFNLIKADKNKLLLVCLSFILQFFIAAVTIKLTYSALGMPITFVSAMMIGVFTSIANLFTVTPNNLGVQEVVIAYLISMIGLDFTYGIIGAGLMRVIHMLITFTLAPVYAYVLLQGASVSSYVEN